VNSEPAGRARLMAERANTILKEDVKKEFVWSGGRVVRHWAVVLGYVGGGVDRAIS
jgi:hypothetical protein